MEITSIKKQSPGYLVNGNIFVPEADGNSEYELVKKLIEDGFEIEPEFTDEEISAKEITQAIWDKKNLGIDYTHTDNEVYKVSLTADDANGITSLKVASDTFEFFATVFYFSNGTKVPLNSETDLLSLGAFIVSERAKFFTE